MARSPRRLRVWLLVAAAAIAAGAASLAMGATQNAAPEVTLKFGYVTPPTHPYGRTMTQFQQKVQNGSNGRIGVTLIPVFGGGDDIALLNSIKGGSVDGGAVSAAIFPNAKIFSFVALQMPFLLDNYALESKVIATSSPIAQRMLKLGTERAGLKGLAIFEGGERQLVLKKGPVNSLADLKGLKLRSVQSPLLADTLAALGTNPTPLAVGDVFGALQNGTVDGLEANSGLTFTNKFYEAGATHITLANLFPFPAILIMNGDKWNSLSPEFQQIIQNAARQTPAFSLGIVSNTQLFPSLLCAAGVKYHVPSAATKKAMLKAVAPVYAKYEKNPQVRSFVTAIQKLKVNPKLRGGAESTDAPPASCLE
jgi:tripartite ATP-independent transporter DctP family solute receptor